MCVCVESRGDKKKKCCVWISIPKEKNLLLLLFAELNTNFAKVKIFTGTTTVDVQHVEASRLKVGRSIVRLGDKKRRFMTVILWTKIIANSQKPIKKKKNKKLQK